MTKVKWLKSSKTNQLPKSKAEEQLTHIEIICQQKKLDFDFKLLVRKLE